MKAGWKWMEVSQETKIFLNYTHTWFSSFMHILFLRANCYSNSIYSVTFWEWVVEMVGTLDLAYTKLFKSWPCKSAVTAHAFDCNCPAMWRYLVGRNLLWGQCPFKVRPPSRCNMRWMGFGTGCPKCAILASGLFCAEDNQGPTDSRKFLFTPLPA